MAGSPADVPLAALFEANEPSSVMLAQSYGRLRERHDRLSPKL